MDKRLSDDIDGINKDDSLLYLTNRGITKSNLDDILAKAKENTHIACVVVPQAGNYTSGVFERGKDGSWVDCSNGKPSDALER